MDKKRRGRTFLKKLETTARRVCALPQNVRSPQVLHRRQRRAASSTGRLPRHGRRVGLKSQWHKFRSSSRRSPILLCRFSKSWIALFDGFRLSVTISLPRQYAVGLTSRLHATSKGDDTSKIGQHITAAAQQRRLQIGCRFCLNSLTFFFFWTNVQTVPLVPVR